MSKINIENKAYLVFDEMPENCSKCPIRRESYCGKTGKMINTEVRPVNRCPLRYFPVPVAEKEGDNDNIKGFVAGWNMCRQEIAGGGAK